MADMDCHDAAFQALAGIGTALRGSWSPRIDANLKDALLELAYWAADTLAERPTTGLAARERES